MTVHKSRIVSNNYCPVILKALSCFFLNGKYALLFSLNYFLVTLKRKITKYKITSGFDHTFKSHLHICQIYPSPECRF